MPFLVRMNTYSYNQEKSISRLDQLLNRNELIYQNLKQKLSEINKSSSNIHKNITYCHEYWQQAPLSNSSLQLASHHDSSLVQQENLTHPPLSRPNSSPFQSQHQDQLIDSQHHIQEQHRDSDCRRSPQNTADFGGDREIEELLARPQLHNPVPDPDSTIGDRGNATYSVDNTQLNEWNCFQDRTNCDRDNNPKQWQKNTGDTSKHQWRKCQADQSQGDRTAHLEIENLTHLGQLSISSPRLDNHPISSSRTESEGRAPSLRRKNSRSTFPREPIHPSNELSSTQIVPPKNEPASPKSNRGGGVPLASHCASLMNTVRSPKGNSIYLIQVPKTENSPLEDSFQEMPTFRSPGPTPPSPKQHHTLLSPYRETPKPIEQEVIESRSRSRVSVQTHSRVRQEEALGQVSGQSGVELEFKERMPSGSEENKRRTCGGQERVPCGGEERVPCVGQVAVSDHTKPINDSWQTEALSRSTGKPKPMREITPMLERTLQLQTPSESLLFAPFNKVYRSPILQLKAGGMVLLERKSKTAAISRSSCIADPIKFKFKTVLTDEQAVLRTLFGGQSQTLDLSAPQTNKVLVVGGRDTLKKKIHLGLLAFVLQAAAQQIENVSSSFYVTVEHQESGKSGQVSAHIEVRPGSQKVSLMELERAGQDVASSVVCGRGERVLRVSRVGVHSVRSWQFSVISSNRVDCEFVRCLGASRVCWTINPLIKNYEQVANTLQAMQKFSRGSLSQPK